jgi:hypothetical protein
MEGIFLQGIGYTTREKKQQQEATTTFRLKRMDKSHQLKLKPG